MVGSKHLQEHPPRYGYNIPTGIYERLRHTEKKSNQIETILNRDIISKEYKNFCSEQNIIRKYGTPNLHTGTGLVERTIHSMKNLIKANLENTQNLRESLKKALYVLRFTTHTEMKKKPFEQHFGRKPRTKLSNLKNAISVDSKELSVYITRNSTGEITDHLVMSKRKSNDPKYWRGMTFTQNKKPSNTVSYGKNHNYPFTFYEKAHTKSSLGSKFENKLSFIFL